MSRIFLFLILFLFSFGVGKAQQPIEFNKELKSNSFWFGANVGQSLLLEKAPDSLLPEFKDYFNKLRSGWHTGAEADYFFTKYIGIGLKYTRFITKQEVDSLIFKFFTNTYYINLSNTMTINSISAFAYAKMPIIENKLFVIGGLGPSWLFYRKIGKSVTDSSSYNGSSPGLSACLRLNYQIIKNLNLEIQASYIRAYLSHYTQDNGTSKDIVKFDKGNYLNISRRDFSFGVFYTFPL
jgi:hypothetical protein